VLKKYGPDQVAFIHWDFPLQSHGVMAMVAAEAAHCAGEQASDAYWTVNDRLFESQIPVEEIQPTDEAAAIAKAVGIVRELGLDGDAVRGCLEGQRYRPIVGALQQQALERGVEMTPTLVVVSRNPATGEYGDPETVLGAASMAEFEAYLQRSISRSQGTVVPTPTPPPTATPAPVTATP
jgi:protein-disulfide isomerase